jgi:outer membrane protein assembly factor BamB
MKLVLTALVLVLSPLLVLHGQSPAAQAPNSRTDQARASPLAVKPGARGDLTLAKDATASPQVAWSKTGHGSYMPTPTFYRGIVYVLANNGVFDAYEAETGKEVYRQRLPLVGRGFSASPAAADGKICLSNEDGEMGRRGRRDVQAHRHQLDARNADGHAGAF